MIILADKESRKQHNNDLEWALHFDIFMQTSNIFGPFDFDLFASRTDIKHACYVSLTPHPVDAFTLNWSTFNLPYVFAPFSLLGRILQKVEMDRARCVVIAQLSLGSRFY